MISSIKGLFINNRKAQDSIYESGIMVFDCLRLSGQYSLDYVEIDIDHREIPVGYHFYFFNYHPSTLYWLDTKSLRKLGSPVITMVLEVLPGDPFVMCPKTHFDAYCVIDPTLKSANRRVFSFPRPLEGLPVCPHEPNEIPVIGTFGFATRGKGFQHVVDSVNKEFDRAIVRINIPFGDFVPDSEAYSKFLAGLCKERAKEGIDVVVTHEYMDKKGLVDWCSENTLNCFLYDREMPGLAATTDQAILSGRPLSVSANPTFRHITAYLPPYPQWSLQRSIRESADIVLRMREAWAPEKFALKFEEVLTFLSVQESPTVGTGQLVLLPVKKNGWWEKTGYKIQKYRRLLVSGKIFGVLFPKSSRKHEELI